MATESVTKAGDPTFQAITEHFTERHWRESKLPSGVANRLKHVDRCIQAIDALTRMMAEDRRGKEDARDQGETYEGIRPYELDGLGLAVEELLSGAMKSIEEIREDRYGCNGTFVIGEVAQNPQ